MAHIPSDVLHLLEAYPLWEETTARLLRHAHNKIQRLTWKGKVRGHPPEGIQPDDIVQTVYEKVVAGTRRWNPDQHPELFEYLKDQVDSEISNLVQSAENRRFRRESDVAEVPDPSTPEALVLAEEQERQNEEFFLGFLDFLADEPELQQVVEAIVDGIAKPAEIAHQLGVKPDEIYARKKKLQRRLEEYEASRAPKNTPSKGGTSRA